MVFASGDNLGTWGMLLTCFQVRCGIRGIKELGYSKDRSSQENKFNHLGFNMEDFISDCSQFYISYSKI